jgi:hypothetical protein
MTDAELKELLYKAYEDRKGEYELLKAQAEKLVMGIIGASKEVLIECGTLKRAVGLIIDVIDDKTSTGLLDVVDSLIAKQLMNWVINDKMEKWYQEKRAEILGTIE